MTEPQELTVDTLGGKPTTQMIPEDDRVWPHMPPRSTVEAFYQPREDTGMVVVEASTTPHTEAGNMMDGRPHFARLVEGETETLCGQCGQVWPCSYWEAMTRPDPAELQRGGGPAVISLEQAAAAVGLTAEELGARLADQHKLINPVR